MAAPDWLEPLLTQVLDNANQQNQQALAANNRGKNSLYKLQPLSTTDGESWLTWKTTFEMAARGNRWTNSHARLALASHMTGDAHLLIKDIPVEDVPVAPAVDAAGYAALVALYEAKFMATAAEHVWRDKYEDCRQDGRSPRLFATELKTLFLTIQPDQRANIETNKALMFDFLRRLDSTVVATWVRVRKPQTFTDMVNDAEDLQSAFNLATKNGQSVDAGQMHVMTPEPMAIHAMAQGRGQRREAPAGRRPRQAAAAGSSRSGEACWICDSPAHRMADCHKYAHLSRVLSRPARSNGGGRSGAASGNPRQGKNNGGGRKPGKPRGGNPNNLPVNSSARQTTARADRFLQSMTPNDDSYDAGN